MGHRRDHLDDGRRKDVAGASAHTARLSSAMTTSGLFTQKPSFRPLQITDKAMAANAAAGISNRPVTGEPLYVLLNLGYATVTIFEICSTSQTVDRVARSGCTQHVGELWLCRP